tara:strand:+ start:589 stop:690 length:102 start_codon:yes stop_codon:yes gene_type:complete
MRSLKGDGMVYFQTFTAVEIAVFCAVFAVYLIK